MSPEFCIEPYGLVVAEVALELVADVIAPVTSTLRDIPTCIPVGPDHGIDHDSVANFDNLAAVPKSVLTTRLGQLGIDGRRQICEALDALANC